MSIETHRQLYRDYLEILKKEMSLYKDEKNIWKTEGEVKNSSGNLCLHICGNLNHFFGATIGNTGYVRDRDSEFSKKGLSREELLKGVDDTIEMMEKIFDNLNDEKVNEEYPNDWFGKNVSIGYVITRLVSHLSYHVGQINYNRRLTDV